MTKYFKAEVLLCQTVTVSVAADDEDSARRQAKELAMQRLPGACVSQIGLTFEGEAEFRSGTRVKHFLFGEGQVLGLARTTNAANEFGLRATIQFSSGDTKDFQLPLPKDKLEVLVS